jgi:DNA-binding ferritin-like protein
MRQTKRRTVKKRKLHKANIIETFLGMLNTVKLYHWNTYSFSEHKATDKLYKLLNEHIDKFVEIMLGKNEREIPKFSEKIMDSHKSNFTERIHQYRDFLINLNNILDKEHDTDLLSVRDEILGDINRFLYIMTLTK